MRRRSAELALFLSGIFLLSMSAAAQQTNVAVFNFQMKSATPDWVWLQKGLADQITTDFTQTRRLRVLARDDMQSVADRVRWTPELASDERTMQEVRRALAIEYLVTGVYEVAGDRIRITAQVVQPATRKEVAREQAEGPVQEVLELQRGLSAKLLSWFSGTSAEKILPQLAVWTRSVPAARALYEGMHLYDQGRFGEAWLRFRRAAGKDADYLEAQYWVARMYYFMDRYEHARRAYERFVYMDASHPRLGDAIKEYLHTYEKLDAPAETLLWLYRDLEQRYPEAGIYGEMGGRGPIPNRAWLWARQAQVLCRLGRLDEAIVLGAKAAEALPMPYYFSADAMTTGLERIYNLMTGKVLVPRGPDKHRFPEYTVFPEGQTEVRLAGGRSWFGLGGWEGHRIKKLTFYPVGEGKGGTVKVTLWNWNIGDIQPDGNQEARPFEEARDKGIAFSRIPRLGMLRGYVTAGGAALKETRVVAEFEKLGPHGMLYVDCTNTIDFEAEVVGLCDRGNGQQLGLLPAGEHTVRFYPRTGGYPFGQAEAKVKVRAGEATTASVTLPWEPGSSWTAWEFCRTGSVPPDVGLQDTDTPPAFQMDDKAIRFLQISQGDVWVSTSQDGREFSQAVKIPMPVSSGWDEIHPGCLRDESGRFLLAFLSDRNAQREMRPYVCWSRDFVNWSAPAMVLDRPVRFMDLTQDDKGRFLFVHSSGSDVTVQASRDAYRWEKLAELTPGGEILRLKIIQRSDGTYELFAAHRAGSGVLDRFLSKDGITWTPAGRVTTGHSNKMQLAVTHAGGRTTAAVMVSFGKFRPYEEYSQIARERPDGQWEESPPFVGFARNSATMAYHPRWGYYVGWRVGAPQGQKWVILHGPSLDKVFETPAEREPANSARPG